VERALEQTTPRPLEERARSFKSARWWKTVAILFRNRTSLVGLLIIVGMAAGAVLAPAIAPYSPTEIHIRDKVTPPNSTYWFGTDSFGRDILSRLLYGSRISLVLSVLGVLLATVLGVSIGAVAGFVSGWLDDVLMRLMDILLSFPYIILAIALISTLGPSVRNIILVVAFTRVPQFARMARGSVISLREAEFVVAARTTGMSDLGILMRHVMPNIVTPIVVLASLSMSTAILTESSLSFLGLGVQPPTATWGTMIGDGRNYVDDGFWISTVPGIAISLTILGFNLLGDGLRDALDPRLRSRT
jgi:peptide/nickel transport system permease protein